jgi:hypothetical protein
MAHILECDLMCVSLSGVMCVCVCVCPHAITFNMMHVCIHTYTLFVAFISDILCM